jgi:hypothetical protein
VTHADLAAELASKDSELRVKEQECDKRVRSMASELEAARARAAEAARQLGGSWVDGRCGCVKGSENALRAVRQRRDLSGLLPIFTL